MGSLTRGRAETSSSYRPNGFHYSPLKPCDLAPWPRIDFIWLSKLVSLEELIGKHGSAHTKMSLPCQHY
jgi:hypothetical protein